MSPWFLHETPSSVISAILHEYDITLTVSLSMISTYRKFEKNKLLVYIFKKKKIKKKKVHQTFTREMTNKNIQQCKKVNA